MRFVKYLRDHLGFSTVVGAATLDGYRRQIRDRVIAENNMNIQTALNNKDRQLYHNAISNEHLKSYVEASVGKIKEIDIYINSEIQKAQFIDLKLRTGSYQTGDTSQSLLQSYNYHISEINRLNTQKNVIKDDLVNHVSDFINKNDLSSYISELYDKYQNFLSTLTTDQIVIIFNLTGIYMLLITFINITILLIGDNLIERFNLEVKFPKLAKYILIKKKLNTNLLKIYILSFYVIILILVLSNLYMFFIKYFI